MGLFSRKSRACDVCRMRGYHDDNVHRVRARELARDIKNLREELKDDNLEKEQPHLARRYEFELVDAEIKLEDEAQILGLSDLQVEEMILAA